MATIERLKKIMYAKHNHGHAEAEPGISWDRGVNRALDDLELMFPESSEFWKGYIETLKEYLRLIEQDNQEDYTKKIWEKETGCPYER